MSADVLLGRITGVYGGGPARTAPVIVPSSQPAPSSADVFLGRLGISGGIIPAPAPSVQSFGPAPSVQSFGPGVSTSLGAGQGPIPATGQLADNPFQNTFNFQIPQTSDGGAVAGAPTTGGGGYGQYVPLIIVGVIVAGIGYYAFGRKKR